MLVELKQKASSRLSSLGKSIQSAFKKQKQTLNKFKPYFSRRDLNNLYALISSQHSKDKDDKHEPKTTNIQQLKIIAKSSQPQMKLLCAKSCLLSGNYILCQKVLKKIQIVDSKTLYQKIALMIQASYLQNPQNQEKIKQIWKTYTGYRQQTVQFKLHKLQYQILKQLKDVALSYHQVKSRCQQIDKRLMKDQIDDIKFTKNLQGMPSYLVSVAWFEDFTKFVVEQNAKSPGPITNFSMLDFVYQYQFSSKGSEPDQYLDRLLFPVDQEIDFIIISARLWKVLYEIFGGIPIRRAFIKNPSYRVMDGGDTMKRILVRLNQQQKYKLYQIQGGNHWQTSIIPKLSHKFGAGQLKAQINGQQHLKIKGKIQNIEYRYRFITFKTQKIHVHNQQQQQTKKYLCSTYNMQKYTPILSESKGNLGISLDPNKTTYFNTVIQVLSQLQPFSQYFLTNQFFGRLDLCKYNTEGRFGEVACWLAHIIKDLWFLKPEISVTISIKQFKLFILNQYYKQAIDSSDQMVFRAPIRKTQPFRRKSKIQQFMEFRIPPKQDKALQRDPGILLKVLLRAIAGDLSDQVPSVRPNTTITTLKNFTVHQIWQLYHDIRQFYFKYNDSIIHQLFGGMRSTIFQCKICSYKKLKLEPFRVFDLTVPLDNPRQTLYFVPKETIGQQAIRVNFCTDGIKNLGDLIKHVRTQLQVDANSEIVAFMVNKKFEFIENKINQQNIIKDLFERVHSLGDTLFLYEKFQMQDNQIYALIEYKYRGFQKKQNLADGFPRLIPVQLDLLQIGNQNNLINYLLNTIPLAVYQCSKLPCIQSVKVQKNSPPKKGHPQKIYQYHIYLNTKNPIKNFRYIPFKQTIGNVSASVHLKLEQCFQNFIQQTLINAQKVIDCPRCHKLRNINTYGNLYNIGDVFIVRLDRFGETKKITTMISYPLQKFDPYKYVTTKKMAQKYYNSLKKKKEKKLAEPLVEQLQSVKEYYYNLVGVIVHRGSSLSGGSFLCYCKNLDGKWYEFNNQHVKQIKQQLVVDLNAYILIYQKDPTAQISERKQGQMMQEIPFMKTEQVDQSVQKLNIQMIQEMKL